MLKYQLTIILYFCKRSKEKIKTMKKRISILLIMISLSLFSFAQTIGDYIDVVYLKNGSIIKGIIIEQVPGKTVKIKTNDGSEFVYNIQEVEKFTREEKVSKRIIEEVGISKATPDSLKYMNNFKMKTKGYFAEIDALFNTASIGLRLTNGYRFGRFGNIGLAIGLEALNSDFYYGDKFPALSLNLVYSGEILKKRITPFYQIEAGYGFSLDRYGGNRGFTGFGNDIIDETWYYGREEIINYGGPMGAIALGVKFATKRKIYYKLSLDARITTNFSDVHSSGYYIEETGISTPSSFYQNFTTTPGLGIRFGIGF